MLGLPKHRIAVQARRAGGGFGAKLTRCCQNAAAAAVCARKLGRPVRVANDRTTDFVMVRAVCCTAGGMAVGRSDPLGFVCICVCGRASRSADTPPFLHTV